MNHPDQDKPDVSLHPPTVFLVLLLSGYVLKVFLGGVLPVRPIIAEGVGGLIVLASLYFAIAAIASFSEKGETLRPDSPSQGLICDGVFEYSRNPIYLAMVLFGLGFGLATTNLWMILTSFATGAILHFLVIPNEEDYLDRRFGGEYRDYCGRVRRWL